MTSGGKESKILAQVRGMEFTGRGLHILCTLCDSDEREELSSFTFLVAISQAILLKIAEHFAFY